MSFHSLACVQAQPSRRCHNGLPDGWNRDRFRQLCVSYAQIKGLSAQCIRTLEIIIDMIAPGAFRDVFQAPCCYARQETLIAGRGLTDRTIHNHERALEAIGLIERRLGANGARCKRQGLGLYLTAALNLIPDMLDAQERNREAQREHDLLRGDRSRLYRHVKASLTPLLARPCPPEIAVDLMEEFCSWPRSDKLKYMPLDHLRSHVEAALDLWKRVDAIAENPGEISGAPEAGFGCHTQDQIEDKILSCTAENATSRHSAGAADGPAQGSKDKNPAEPAKRAPENLPRVSNRLLYELASPELRMHIDIAGGGGSNPNPSLYAIETGTWTRLAEIGTTVAAWQEAITHLGVAGAILAGLITDARLTDPKQPRLVKPGGYLRGMVRAGQEGELNLMSSFRGLLARRAREDVQLFGGQGRSPLRDRQGASDR